MMRFSINGTFLSIVLVTLLVAGCRENAAPGSSSTRAEGLSSYIRGAQALSAGRDVEAERDLQEAVKTNPSLTMAQLRLGDLYRQRGQYQQAADRYIVATKLDPYGFSNHYYLGLCQHLLNRLEEAATSYLRALKLEPKDAPTNMNLGLVFVALGKPQEGERYIEIATEINDKSGTAFTNLGVALDDQGKYKQAEIAYRKAIELDSDNPATLLNLGTNLTLQERPADAIPVLQRAVRIADTPLAHRRLGEALAAAGKLDEAIAQFDTSLKLNPLYYQAMNSKGSAYIARYQRGLQLDEGLKEQALATWRRSMEINPDQLTVQLLIKKWTGG